MKIPQYGVWEKIKENDYLIKRGLKMKLMKFIPVLETKLEHIKEVNLK